MPLVEDVLTFLTRRMQFEAEWAVQKADAFTWWPSALAQRVWTAPARDFQGIELTALHIETDLLADVTFNSSSWPRLAAVNRYATLSAYVADIASGTIRLHASVSLTTENHLLARAIALHAMALQIADAHAEAQQLADAFGATAAASAHPVRGPRVTPDEMVKIGDVYQERGEADSPFGSEELAQLVHLDPRPWLLAANELHRVDADLDFAPGLPSRLEFDAGEPHPALGSGLQMRLMLPVDPDPMIAQTLNANECLEPDAHQLGAWCVDDDRGLHFAGFVPAAAHMPGLSRALAYHMSARNDWARALLFPAG
ncbi:MAG: hypothetical protein Q7R30_05850 [Acidobacteriota bacterium]|nr:hypothetical protein [Acidobacteriota bacterium]